MRDKLAEIARTHAELTARMADPAIYEGPGLFQQLAKEVAAIEPVALHYLQLVRVERELAGAEAMAADEPDGELRAFAEAEVETLRAQVTELEAALQALLLPRDPDDDKNVILEIRAGTGGEEAALFAADLYRMYARYAERRGWRVETLSESAADAGGIKEVIARVSGDAVYSALKFEAGVHRVQRVPATESQGRIHTSACTVAILPEAEEVEVDLPPGDLRIDTYRSSGAGGQHVNTTDSAIRITHLPTGVVVTCQDEKSQHKNKAKALIVLRARLLDRARAEASSERADARRAMVGSGDRSERIRTYNFPQNRLTDHRIGLTLYRLDELIEGDLGPVIEPLRAALVAEQLRAQSEQ